MTKKLLAALLFLATGLLAQPAQSFPALNLVPGLPNISSFFITVDYVGDNTAGLLTASGFANQFTPQVGAPENIAGGTFDISASIGFNSLTAAGSLNIGGTVAALGFNSGTLLTGTLSAFGAGPGDPLEFLFQVTGGDAAGDYGGIGSTAGVILSNSGYPGSFANNFTSGAFQALSDTFVQAAVSEPASLALFLLGLFAFAWARQRSTA